jgi:hypothetical protein
LLNQDNLSEEVIGKLRYGGKESSRYVNIGEEKGWDGENEGRKGFFFNLKLCC